MPGFQLLGDANAMRRQGGGGSPPAASFNNILIEGDSITSNDPSTPDLNFYSYRYDALRTDKTIEVRADGSRLIGTIANLNDGTNRLMGKVSDDLSYAPDLVTVLIGANDLSTGNAADYRNNMIAYHPEITANGAKLAWSAPIPYNSSGTPHPNIANFTTQRAALLATCRDPAVWGQYCDYYIPMGEHPDFNDAGLVPSLYADTVHPTGYNINGTGGQNKLYDVYKAAVDTIIDTSRVNSTSPYAFVWPVDQTGLALDTAIQHRFILSGLAPASNHDMGVTGAEFRRNGGAWNTSLAGCYNGDVIDIRKTTSVSANSPVMYSLTIGSETRVITLTTTASVTPVVYNHGGIVTDPNPLTTKTFTGLAFDSGLAVLSIVASAAFTSGVTIGGVAATLVRQQTLTGTAGRGFDIYTCPVTAGNHDVVITRTASSSRCVMTYGTAQNTSGVVANDGSSPTGQSQPHLVPSMTVPANGLMLGWLLETGNDAMVAATVNSPSTFIAEGFVSYQSGRHGLCMGKRHTTGQIGFSFPFGTLARAGIVLAP